MEGERERERERKLMFTAAPRYMCTPTKHKTCEKMLIRTNVTDPGGN